MAAPRRTAAQTQRPSCKACNPRAGRCGKLAAASGPPLRFSNLDRPQCPRGARIPLEEQILLLERLHLLFQVRACASLALGQNADAAEDVLAGLRLARLARQLPDARSTVRAQLFLTRSLQPLWEGLSQHAWTETQLAAFQHELAGFNLLADYTNAVRRVVLAHIEVWRRDSRQLPARIIALPAADGGYLREPAWATGNHARGGSRAAFSFMTPDGTANEQVDARRGPHPTSQQLVRPRRAAFGSPQAGSCSSSRRGGEQIRRRSPSRKPPVNQAIIACALERFHLANGAYPEPLDELVPCASAPAFRLMPFRAGP